MLAVLSIHRNAIHAPFHGLRWICFSLESHRWCGRCVGVLVFIGWLGNGGMHPQLWTASPTVSLSHAVWLGYHPSQLQKQTSGYGLQWPPGPHRANTAPLQGTERWHRERSDTRSCAAVALGVGRGTVLELRTWANGFSVMCWSRSQPQIGWLCALCLPFVTWPGGGSQACCCINLSVKHAPFFSQSHISKSQGAVGIR